MCASSIAALPSDSASIKKYNELHSGTLVTYIDELTIPASYLNIILDFDFNYLWQYYQVLKNNMKNVCEILDISLKARAKLYDINDYQNLIKKVQKFKNEVQNNQITINKSISDIIHSTIASQNLDNTRKKRDIPYAAEVLKFVYGVATDEELQAINNRMRDLNMQNSGLIKQINSLVVYYNLTQQYISSMVLKLDNFVIEVGQTRVEDLINYYRTLYLLQVAGMHLEINKLNNLITNIQNNKLTADLISPENLLAILTSFDTENLKTEDLKLIYPIHRAAVHKYYAAAQVQKIQEDAEKFRLLISIPLKTLRSNFNIFQLEELPHHIQESQMAAYYALNYKQIAISKDRQHYILLDDSHLRSCTGANPLICPLDTAVINTNIYSCALSILLNDTNQISQKCQIKMKTKNLPYFKRLKYNQHSWIYSTRDAQLGVLFCPSLRKVQSYKVQGTGLLELKPGCFFNSDNYILYPLTTHSFKYTRENQEIILQNLISYQDFQSDIDKIFKKHNATFQEMLTHINVQLSESETLNLQSILSDLDNTKFNIYLQEIKYWLHKFKYSFKIGSIIFASVLIIIIIAKFSILSICWKIISSLFSICACRKRNLRQD